MSDPDNHDAEQPSLWGDPFQTIVNHFTEAGIHFKSNREERRLWFSMNSGSALMKCSSRFDRTGDVLQFHIQYPLLVKKEFRPIAAEFLTRANYNLVIGSFEMDWKDGEVRYHVAHMFRNEALAEESVHRLFGCAITTAERYFPAFMRVLFAGETPEDGVDLAELDMRDFEAERTKKKPKRRSTGGGKKEECRAPSA